MTDSIHQSVFIPKETALLHALSELKPAVESEKLVLLTLLDMGTAFDTANQ